MKSIFINQDTQIIRAGWRILIFAILFAAFNAILMFGVRTILGSLPAAGTLWFILLGIAATLAALLTTKYISKKPFKSLGLKWNKALKDLMVGVVISALIMTLMYVMLLVFGLIEFEGFSWWNEEPKTVGAFNSSGLWTALVVLIQFVIVAWWEELAFRGIILQNIAVGLNIKWGVILSTLGFAILHAGNPNATVLSTILIMLITLKLVYAYLKSGQLWLSIGLHLGWNFFQASVFGFASSGHQSPSLIAQTPVGADWLSGGAFGAENSVIIIPLTLGSFYLMHWWVKYSRGLKNYKMFNYLVSDNNPKQAQQSNVMVRLN